AAVDSVLLIVVDGLGWANLRARRGHARTLAALEQRRIETVTPSTTAAALTAIVTGALPGEHGLIGYRILHPESGRILTTISDWDDVGEPGQWQRATPLFHAARAAGLTVSALGRPAHRSGGLTAAILSGAEYRAGASIEDRFAEAERLLRQGPGQLIYLYVDELDRAGHQLGWESDAWTGRLEQLDAAVAGLLARLPKRVGVALTADHGMVDVPAHKHRFLDADEALFAEIDRVGGEPRFRYLFLRPGVDPAQHAERWRAREGKRAWVGTRDEAIAAGLFGEVAPEVRERMGEVILAARGLTAYYTSGPEDEAARSMIGQHGSLTEEEQGVPLVLAGAFAGGLFARA
ncbi:alkaline phosphatase family protein, partial [Leucobacter sp. M11]|uniref:alkaline phosphatase family protein n=1 Tax=Leucobacter sp. M11 TaxID=2993565 RepID=UPI002D80CA90